MRHLFLALAFISSLTLQAQGSIVCSTAKTNLKVGGVILDDYSQGIRFSYTNGITFTHKFIGKTTASNGQITIHGHLVSLTKTPKAKSWFALSEEAQDNELFSAFKYSPIYKMDGSILKDKIGRINIRCTNLREAASFLPELTEAQVNELKAIHSL